MPSLKPWYRVEGVQPREDLRLNKPLNEADFAVNLDHIRRGESHADYVKPHLFFARTYLTKSLRELAAGVVRRLSGETTETAAVYNMVTQFGGGKTHALATLYHLAKGGDAARAWQGVDAVLIEAGVKSVPKADVAVVVGTEFDLLSGRQEGSGPVRKTLWGEIAWQLGGEKAFRVVAEHEARGVAPAGDVIREMLPPGPCLILLDEMVNFVGRSRQAGLRDQVFDFVQNLSETVRARKNAVLCVSVPKSITQEMSPEDEEDYSRLLHVLGRLSKAIMMSADLEIAEIIRRRLFEWQGIPKEGEQAAQEYAAWARENAGALTGIDADHAYEQFKAAYPFHPAALSVFQRKWQSIPRFQRTRGVLRLLALWVARAFQEDHRQQFPEPVIGLGSAPLDDPRFRAAAFDQLGTDNLEGPATTDIAGSANAHAVRMDKEANDAIKKSRLHQKVATAIFFESNGGHINGQATLGEIKAAVGGPQVNLADVDHVLEELLGGCYYLLMERNRYRFSTTPNVNKILTDRRAAVQPKQIDDHLKKEIERVFDRKTVPKDYDLDIRTFPERTNEVPDRPILTLVVMDHEKAAEAPSTGALIEQIIKECGSTGRTMKSALLFIAAETGGAMRDAARDVLAWQEIDEDGDTKGRLDEGQRRLLVTKVASSKRDLEDAIWRAYSQLFLLGRDGKVRTIPLGKVTRSAATSPVEYLLARLSETEEVIGAPNANRLEKWWPPALSEWTTKALRDAFFASPMLSKLKKPDLIRRTISDGVGMGVIGYARKRADGTLTGLIYNKALPEQEVEISEDTVVLRADDAKKLLEPARLAAIRVSPDGREVEEGESIAFSASGQSQYGEPFPCEGITWAATGGVIDSTGKFVAAGEGGVFSATATCGAMTGSATIRIRRRAAAGGGAGETSGGAGADRQMLLWSGEVPTQKWQTFYMKVLARFANTPGLKLSVKMEVPADAPDAKAKADEARSALRELGLQDRIDLM